MEPHSTGFRLAQPVSPKLQLFLRMRLRARAVRRQSGRDDPCFLQAMIENNQAVIKADLTVRQFQIIRGVAFEARFNKVLQIVSPVTKTAAERKRQIQFLEQLVARHQAVQQMPGISELHAGAFGGEQLAAGAKGAEG